MFMSLISGSGIFGVMASMIVGGGAGEGEGVSNFHVGWGTAGGGGG